MIEERDRKLKVEIKSEPMEVGIILPAAAPPPDDKNLVLDTMSEFCRNVGDNNADKAANLPSLRVPTKVKRTNVQSSKRSSNKNQAALDPDDELLQHALENDDLDDDAMDDTPAGDVNTKPFRLEDALLVDEPVVGRGLGSALKLAMQKGLSRLLQLLASFPFPLCLGYIKQEKSRQNARFVSDISAKNYTVEEKNS